MGVGWEGGKDEGENGGVGKGMQLGSIVAVGVVATQEIFKTLGCSVYFCISSGICKNSVFNVLAEEGFKATCCMYVFQ